MVVHFIQGCPSCGRRLRVRAALVNTAVACQHCGQDFVATGNTSPQSGPSVAAPSEARRTLAASIASEPLNAAAGTDNDDLLVRVDRVLARVESGGVPTE